MKKESKKTEKARNICPACKKKWVDHDGVIETCSRLKEANTEIENLKIELIEARVLLETSKRLFSSAETPEARKWIVKRIEDFLKINKKNK